MFPDLVWGGDFKTFFLRLKAKRMDFVPRPSVGGDAKCKAKFFESFGEICDLLSIVFMVALSTIRMFFGMSFSNP